MIGGGILRNYLQFGHLPCQSELDGFFCPRRALRLAELITTGSLRQALAMIEEWERVLAKSPAEIPWQARNQVAMHTLGFASTYVVRPPLVTATEAQATSVADFVRKHPQVFEPVDGQG